MALLLNIAVGPKSELSGTGNLRDIYVPDSSARMTNRCPTPVMNFIPVLGWVYLRVALFKYSQDILLIIFKNVANSIE